MAKLLKGPDGNPMTDAEILHALRVYATNKYGGENKYDFMQIADTIAQVESGNNPFAHQKGGGPGRGKYQYEAASAQSASNRLRDIASIVGYDNPSWNTVSNTQDFSKLTDTQQDIMFLADKLASGDVDLGSLASGDTSSKDFWLDNHWSGKDSERPARSEHWNETVADMKRKQAEIDANSEHIEEPILPPFKYKDGGFRLKKKYRTFRDKAKEPIMSYEELKQYLQKTQGYTGDISMGSYETYLKNKGVTTIPSAEVSTLSDESYNKLSDNQKQVYDAFHGAQTLPYELETKPPGRNINTVRKKDDLHWEDALRMVQDSGVKNIYNTPKDATMAKGYKEGDFRAHSTKLNNSIYIPPSSGYTGAKDKRLKELELVKTLIEGFESGEGNYSKIDGDGKRRPVSQMQYDYYKNERLPILLEGYENFYNNSDRRGLWYESGSLEDSSNFGANNDYVSNLTAELAHVNRRKEQGLPTELADFYKTQGSRAVRAIKEGEWPDRSNYSTESDYEYQTHYAPTGNEARMFSEYNLSSKILRDLAEKKLAKEKSNGSSVRLLKK